MDSEGSPWQAVPGHRSPGPNCPGGLTRGPKAERPKGRTARETRAQTGPREARCGGTRMHPEGSPWKAVRGPQAPGPSCPGGLTGGPGPRGPGDPEPDRPTGGTLRRNAHALRRVPVERRTGSPGPGAELARGPDGGPKARGPKRPGARKAQGRHAATASGSPGPGPQASEIQHSKPLGARPGPEPNLQAPITEPAMGGLQGPLRAGPAGPGAGPRPGPPVPAAG